MTEYHVYHEYPMSSFKDYNTIVLNDNFINVIINNTKLELFPFMYAQMRKYAYMKKWTFTIEIYKFTMSKYYYFYRCAEF